MVLCVPSGVVFQPLLRLHVLHIFNFILKCAWHAQGLSILSRLLQPSYVRSFQLVLGARAEASELVRQTDANSLKLQAGALESSEASERQAAVSAEETSSSAAGPQAEGGGAREGGFPEARAFFTERALEKAREAGISDGVHLESEEAPGG